MQRQGKASSHPGTHAHRALGVWAPDWLSGQALPTRLAAVERHRFIRHGFIQLRPLPQRESQRKQRMSSTKTKASAATSVTQLTLGRRRSCAFLVYTFISFVMTQTSWEPRVHDCAN